MTHGMFSVQEVADRIKAGRKLLLAGDEAALRALPEGAWIGGTIPYFMAASGGLMTKTQIFATELPAFAEVAKIDCYDERRLSKVYKDVPENGFALAIIPASSQAHLSFALNAPSYEGFATRPLLGWIAGVYLQDLGSATPKVFVGRGEPLSDGAAVMHVRLPLDKAAEVSIVNIFRQGSGDTFTFPTTGFEIGEAFVNGERCDFGKYLLDRKVDTRLPMVASFYGANVNVSFQSVEPGKVALYAPVFSGVQYRHAAPIQDYVQEFTRQVHGADGGEVAFSCNCILNYLYSELEGKRTPGFTGPVTFGEIAYQLLNQTMVYLTLTDVRR